jgi:cobalamin biosynthesis protein CobW
MRAISDDARLFDHVLIETSGLAVPTAVLEALHGPALQERFIHDATLAIVDTPLLLAGVYDTGESQHGAPAGAAASEVFQQQLMCADVVVLNKIDQCSADELLRAEAAIRTRASEVRFVELAWQAHLDARLVLGLHLNEFRAQAPSPDMPATAAGHAHGDGHAHSGLGAHEHGLLTHEHVHAEDPGWLSFVLRSQTSQVPDTLHKALDLIAAQEPVLRVKGFAHVRDAAGHLLVQGVRTRIACTMELADPSHPSQPDSLHRHTHTSGTMAELVFIGYHLNRDLVVAKLNEQTGTAWY